MCKIIGFGYLAHFNIARSAKSRDETFKIISCQNVLSSQNIILYSFTFCSTIKFNLYLPFFYSSFCLHFIHGY